MNVKCSFCGNKRDIKHSIVFRVRGSAICEECVEFCTNQIKELRKKSQPQVIGNTQTLEQQLQNSIIQFQAKKV